MDAWKLGLKAVAIYRDNCKVAQLYQWQRKDGEKTQEPMLSLHKTPDSYLKAGTRREMPRVRMQRPSASRLRIVMLLHGW